jgi:hypothetical protein
MSASTTTPATLPVTHTPGGTPIAFPPVGGTGSTTTVPTTVPGGTTAGSHTSGANMANLNIPHGVNLPHFNGSDWATWSGTLEAVLVLYEADDVISHDTCPTGTDVGKWNEVCRCAKAYLCLYIKPDVYSLVALEIDFPTFKLKWDALHNTYGGSLGTTTVFNTWIQLTQACLDDSAPLAPQLAKLNEARVNLHTAGMGVTDTQYCLILLHALPVTLH